MLVSYYKFFVISIFLILLKIGFLIYDNYKMKEAEVHQQMFHHYRRIDSAKKQIDNSPPWSYSKKHTQKNKKCPCSKVRYIKDEFKTNSSPVRYSSKSVQTGEQEKKHKPAITQSKYHHNCLKSNASQKNKIDKPKCDGYCDTSDLKPSSSGSATAINLDKAQCILFSLRLTEDLVKKKLPYDEDMETIYQKYYSTNVKSCNEDELIQEISSICGHIKPQLEKDSRSNLYQDGGTQTKGIETNQFSSCNCDKHINTYESTDLEVKSDVAIQTSDTNFKENVLICEPNKCSKKNLNSNDANKFDCVECSKINEDNRVEQDLKNRKSVEDKVTNEDLSLANRDLSDKNGCPCKNILEDTLNKNTVLNCQTICTLLKGILGEMSKSMIVPKENILPDPNSFRKESDTDIMLKKVSNGFNTNTSTNEQNSLLDPNNSRNDSKSININNTENTQTIYSSFLTPADENTISNSTAYKTDPNFINIESNTDNTVQKTYISSGTNNVGVDVSTQIIISFNDTTTMTDMGQFNDTSVQVATSTHEIGVHVTPSIFNQTQTTEDVILDASPRFSLQKNVETGQIPVTIKKQDETVNQGINEKDSKGSLETTPDISTAESITSATKPYVDDIQSNLTMNSVVKNDFNNDVVPSIIRHSETIEPAMADQIISQIMEKNLNEGNIVSASNTAENEEKHHVKQEKNNDESKTSSIESNTSFSTQENVMLDDTNDEDDIHVTSSEERIINTIQPEEDFYIEEKNDDGKKTNTEETDLDALLRVLDDDTTAHVTESSSIEKRINENKRNLSLFRDYSVE